MTAIEPQTKKTAPLIIIDRRSNAERAFARACWIAAWVALASLLVVAVLWPQAFGEVRDAFWSMF